MNDEEIKKLVEGIMSRAQRMWVEGHPPTPYWWGERIYELIKHLTTK